MAPPLADIFIEAICKKYDENPKKYCQDSVRIFFHKDVDKCVEKMHEKCCKFSDSYCDWHESTWFLVACILLAVLIVVAAIVGASVWYCKKKRAGGAGEAIISA
ncbi:unnamed protein product [Caenorhabditis sp. 36 PRJEB53466]|nr:unnamed protein product [Caenorhabditis sp. 36 PRJEB53466]